MITVGALDKNEGDAGENPIAIYSSQGPTEEGRIKPNIAFVGSSVNAPEANPEMVMWHFLELVWLPLGSRCSCFDVPSKSRYFSIRCKEYYARNCII